MSDSLRGADVSDEPASVMTSERSVNDGLRSAEFIQEPPTGTPQAEKSSGFFAPLRVANFRRLIAGQSVSRLGDQFYFVALPWLVLQVADSAAALALVTGVAAATLGVFSLVGGVLADRYGPRALMLGSDVARLITISVLAALALASTPPLWVLLLLSALLGIAGGLFYPASSSMVPFLLPANALQAGNSFEQLTLQTSNLIGPGVAGVVLGATKLALGFVADAVSFLVSVISLALIRVPKREKQAQGATDPATPRKGGTLRDLGEAYRFLRTSRFLFTLLVLSLVANFAANGLFDVALPLLLKQWVGIGSGPQAFGIVIGGFGLGSILGALVAGAASKLRHKALVAIVTLLPVALLIAVAPFLGGVLPLTVTFAMMGLVIALSNVLFITLIQQAIPMEMMGRMMSFVMLGTLGGTPLSIAAYGVAASLVPNVAWLFIAGGAIFAVAGLVALTQRVFWQAG
ncbi:MAG TPA: MFS transporter [Ktedonobacterales bacterium]|nr:MFS transporter [Ktedonobacterales bacterium]